MCVCVCVCGCACVRECVRVFACDNGKNHRNDIGLTEGTVALIADEFAWEESFCPVITIIWVSGRMEECVSVWVTDV